MHILMKCGIACRSYDYAIQLDVLGSSLAVKTNPRLNALTLNLGFIEEGSNIMHELNLGLKQISKKNVLEVLVVRGMCSTLWVGYYNPNTWAADVDQTLTEIGAFPALRQVTIFMYDETGVSQYPCLEEEYFPRLLESAAITLFIP